MRNAYRPAVNRGRAAVYGRTSTDNQDVGLSTGTQGEHGRRQGELLGFTVGDDDIFLEESGISGMEDDRPKLRALMLKIFSPERPYQALIVCDISRLSRSTGGYINFEEILAEEGIELISIMEPPGNTEVKIDTNRRMKAVMNESMVVDSAVKTRNSQMFACEMGFYIGWVAPFGYRKRKVIWRGAEHTKLEPDPDTWPHLLHIIDMGKTGYSLGQMRQYLASTGLEHPAGKINRRKGGKRGTGRWTNFNVAYLLRQLALLGWTSRGGENSGTKILKKSDQVKCRDAHEAAMTEEERDLILTQLASRRWEVKNPRTHRSPNPLSGLAVCGICGAKMRMHTEDGTQRLYCSSKRDSLKGDPDWCPNPSVKLDLLVERTIEAILGHILTPEVLQRQVKLVAKENKQFVVNEENRRKMIEKRIRKLQQEVDNFMAAIAEYGASNPAYGREIDRRQEEQALLRRQLERISNELEEKLVFINEPSRIVENALDLRTYLDPENLHTLKEMLKCLVMKASIANGVATLDYSLPLPRNGTEEPILTEKLGLNRKSCPSFGLTGIDLG